MRHLAHAVVNHPWLVVLAWVAGVAAISLMARLRLEVAGHGRRPGIARAVGATGGVITSCGLVMASAFLLLARSSLAVASQIGLVVVIGVLLDTSVVRPVLVPALATLLGAGSRQVTVTSRQAAYDPPR